MATEERRALSAEDVLADLDAPTNYVEHILRTTKPLPPINIGNISGQLNYLNLTILMATPIIAIYGLFTVSLRWETAIWSIVYYFITGLGKLSQSFSSFVAISLYEW